MLLKLFHGDFPIIDDTANPSVRLPNVSFEPFSDESMFEALEATAPNIGCAQNTMTTDHLFITKVTLRTKELTTKPFVSQPFLDHPKSQQPLASPCAVFWIGEIPTMRILICTS